MTRRRRTAPGKSRHAPTRLDHYKQIHDTVMEGFKNEGFVISDDVQFSAPKDGYITVRGKIRCQGDIQIDVDKKLKVVGGSGGNIRVQTDDYSYNVSTSEGNLFRYDSAHNHRTHHHVHRYNKRGEESSVLEIRDVNQVPTLGDVITEARDDYYYAPLLQDEDLP